MQRNKAAAKKIQNYYNLSLNYLESAKISLEKELFEPAMFTAIHALELSIKAALITKTDESWKTHNIGGQFGKYFLEEIGDKTCRRINVIISKYNLPRYPSEKALNPQEVEEDIAFIKDFIEHQIFTIL
ncbi:MAG: HEPN domain-containing protein [Candidatus Thermoplasmatota archaeon]|nr:HEPN domain-containing protein [Candidatus Thermoplasmatota archaeon]